MSTAGRRFLPRRVEYAFVLVIIGGMAAVIIPAVRAVRDPRGPNGLAIPAEHPAEVRRVGHSSGLSIVLPVNWEFQTSLTSEPPRIFIYPRGIGRTRSQLAVWLLEERELSSQLENYRRIEFQNFSAYEKFDNLIESTFDDPAWSGCKLFVKRDDQWFCIRFGIQGEHRELPAMIREYINTIRWPVKKSS